MASSSNVIAPETSPVKHAAAVCSDLEEHEIMMDCQMMVTLDGRLFEVFVPEWLQGRTLGNDKESGLNLWYQHGVLVLRVGDDWSPDPLLPLKEGERLLVGFTEQALSGVVQHHAEKDSEWISVHSWLQMQRSVYNKPIPLIAITHRTLEEKQLAQIDLQQRFGFSPKVIGIQRADEGTVTWFPGGSDRVRPYDKLLCNADALDVQLLELKLDVALAQELTLRVRNAAMVAKKHDLRTKLSAWLLQRHTEKENKEPLPLPEPLLLPLPSLHPEPLPLPFAASPITPRQDRRTLRRRSRSQRRKVL